MGKVALVERKRKTERIARIKSQAEHLTIFETDFAESCLRNFCEAEVAADKFTRLKFCFREISIREIAIFENAVFIIAFGEGLLMKVNLLKCFAVFKNAVHYKKLVGSITQI